MIMISGTLSSLDW